LEAVSGAQHGHEPPVNLAAKLLLLCLGPLRLAVISGQHLHGLVVVYRVDLRQLLGGAGIVKALDMADALGVLVAHDEQIKSYKVLEVVMCEARYSLNLETEEEGQENQEFGRMQI
jgi:hypothetical protein